MKIVEGVLKKVRNTDFVDGVFVLPEEVSEIGENAFLSCKSLQKFVGHKNLLKIGDNAFFDCSKLSDIDIPSTVTEIGEHCFLNCISLSKIELPEGIKSLKKGLFDGCSQIKELKIPESVINLEAEVFQNCVQLKSIKLPEGIKKLSSKLFNNCCMLENVKFADDVSIIEDEVFGSCSSLKHMKIPDGIKVIPNRCFMSCSSLECVEFAKDITKISELAFRFCKKLKHIEIPETVNFFGELAFANCESLESIKIPSNVKILSDGLFFKCVNLKKVYIPDSVIEIKEDVFNNCSSLVDVRLPNNLKSLSQGCFYFCKMIKNMKIPESVKSVGVNCFGCCEKLENINLPENVESIHNLAFHDCKSLKKIKISSKIEVIPQYAFTNCESLTEIELSDKVRFIGEAAFMNCINITDVKMPKNLSHIGVKAFGSCKNINQVIIPKSVTNIEKYAFCDTNLDLLKIPSQINNINRRAFNIDIKRVYLYDDFGETEYALCDNSIKNICTKNNITIIEDKKNVFFRMNGEGHNLILKNEKLKLKLLYPDKDYEENINFDDLPSLLSWQESGKFMPSYTVISVLPLSYKDNFYINKNCTRWDGILKASKFASNGGKQSLLKICFALGVFESNQQISFKAHKFIMENIIGKITEERLENKFFKFDLNTGFKSDFVDFFMKYYKDDKSFLVKSNDEDDGAVDLMSETFNRYNMVSKVFENKRLNTNRDSEILTIDHVLSVIKCREYENVENGNEAMAFTVSQYDYSQVHFEALQKIYNAAKSLKKSDLTLLSKKDECESSVKYEFLDKKDPLGLVLGDITNCCQKITSNGSSCMEYGMKNPNSGFVVFKRNETIIGQGWVWFDIDKKLICIDNIEVPNKQKDGINSDLECQKAILETIKRFANNTVKKIKEVKGLEVKKVTIGLANNKFSKFLKDKFKFDKNIEMLSNYSGYSDAKNEQVIIPLDEEERSLV